jgi:glycine dehydrogenase subunit 1
MREIEVTRRFQQRALKDSQVLSFVGAGAYRHFIPAPVSLEKNPCTDETKKENLTASRISNGLTDSLSDLNAMDTTCYAGSDLIAAILRGIGIIQETPGKHQSGQILIASTVNPFYRKAIGTWLKHRGVDPDIVPYDEFEGMVGPDQLISYDKKSVAALIIQYPNYFGVIENIDKISNWTRKRGIALVAIVNPLALGTLKPPGNWGKQGADMAIYDLQTLGLPVCLSGSAPGFISVKNRWDDQLKDAVKSPFGPQEPQPADIWMHARAETYLNYLGSNGLAEVAQQCAINLASLEHGLLENPLLSQRFGGTRFHECVIEFDQVDLPAVLSLCAGDGFQIGYPLLADYPELAQCILFNATEAHLPGDIDAMVDKLSRVTQLKSKAAGPAAPKH